MNNRVHQGHFARKRFGQNFLHDDYIIESIVSAIQPTKDQALVEIGPGLAALTIPVSEQLDHLTVIEIDRDLAERLKQNPLLNNKLTIIEQDALTFDFYKLADELGKPLRVFGNLPYNISTPLMFHLFEYANKIVDMHFMLQKEVVERMVAATGTNDYGRLSIMLQYFFDMECLIDVPPESFKPAPKVDSAVVRMIPQKGRIGIARDFAHFATLVKQAFQQRRKTIHNNLKDWADDAVMIEVGIDPGDRPERIAPEMYVTLSNHLLDVAASA